MREFRQQQKLESDEAFTDFLQKNYISETLFRQTLSRPHQVVQFREERWGLERIPFISNTRIATTASITGGCNAGMPM